MDGLRIDWSNEGRLVYNGGGGIENTDVDTGSVACFGGVNSGDICKYSSVGYLIGDATEKSGEVGEYSGEVGEYCGDVGEYSGEVGDVGDGVRITSTAGL